MHILIVDDELLARSRLRTLLGDCDARHQVSEAAHAADALAQLHISGGRAVDLVLLDIHMPGQDGLALAPQIRRLPPLLLQPLVENAVKHGVEPSAHGGKLRITAEQRGSRVVLTITNTLPPESASGEQRPRGHGIAQANVRERLRLLHDVDCDFQAGVDNGLYRVRISLPSP